MMRLTDERKVRRGKGGFTDVKESLGDGCVLALAVCLLLFCVLSLTREQIMLAGFPLPLDVILIAVALAIVVLGVDRMMAHVRERDAWGGWAGDQIRESLGDALILAFGACFLFFCGLSTVSDLIVLSSLPVALTVLLLGVSLGISILGITRMASHCLNRWH
ncbi:MAG: hypothetical protein NTU41_07115 [Chloroflexi bacterium]|nr:hypothetical protein [Chloroflexota bacterium]